MLSLEGFSSTEQTIFGAIFCVSLVLWGLRLVVKDAFDLYEECRHG